MIIFQILDEPLLFALWVYFAIGRFDQLSSALTEKSSWKFGIFDWLVPNVASVISFFFFWLREILLGTT